MNVAVLKGTLSSETRVRTLPSGSEIVSWEVTTRGDGAAMSVPVQWIDPPAAVRACGSGDEVFVLGTVRRRFFRAAGATASRTEVVGERVARPTQRRAVERLFESVRSNLSA